MYRSKSPRGSKIPVTESAVAAPIIGSVRNGDAVVGSVESSGRSFQAKGVAMRGFEIDSMESGLLEEEEDSAELEETEGEGVLELARGVEAEVPVNSIDWTAGTEKSIPEKSLLPAAIRRLDGRGGEDCSAWLKGGMVYDSRILIASSISGKAHAKYLHVSNNL
jgi:hypothetical protein